MEFVNGSVPGEVPDYGAIFMSNSKTRIESFKLKIFGLPPSYAPFVKQVKSGMVLFLYDSDTRHLYGVFQAYSDGAMSIVHHAYSSSGRRFPAQVKITTLWECDPLPESEFRECIKDNYFSAHKFKFGLSEHQVQSLLHLFRQKQLKVPLSPRQLTRSGRSRNTSSKVGLVDQHKVVSTDNFADLNCIDVGSCSRYITGKDSRQTDDDRFPTRFRMGSDEHHIENDINHSMLRENHGNVLVKEKIARDDDKVSTSRAFENKGYTGNDYDPILSRVDSRNTYGEVSRPAADPSFMRNTSNTFDPINSMEHSGNLLYEGNNVAANHSRVTNTIHDFDSINSRDHPRSLFGERISGVADHSLRNASNGFDPIISGEQLQSLFREEIGTLADHSLPRNAIDDFDQINSRDHPGNSFHDGSSVAPDPSLIRNYKKENTCNLDNEEYYGNSSGNKARRVGYDDFFCRGSMAQYDNNLDFNIGRNSANSLGTLKRIADDERLIISRKNEYNLDSGQFAQPSSFGSLDPKMSNQSYLGFKSNGVHSSPVAYDPDLPSIHIDSSFLAGQNSNYLNKNLHADTNSMPKMYSLSQPFQHQSKYSNIQPEVKTRSCIDGISNIPPSTAGYQDTKGVYSGEDEAYIGLHGSELSLLAPPAVQQTENQCLDSEDPYSSIHYRNASLLKENQQSGVLNEEHGNKMPWHESKVFDICSSNSSHPLGSTKRICNETRHYDHSTKPHRELKGVEYDIPKKRNSVFERLTVAPKVKKQSNDINFRSDEDGVDDSVKEIMGMLRRDHKHWTKGAKKTSPVENSTRKKSLSFSNKKESSKSENMDIDHALDNKNNPLSNLVPNLVSACQDRPIVNFKRRSQLREKFEQNLSSDQVDNASPTIPTKKRKLIRPDFGKTGSSQDTEGNINNMDITSSATPERNLATDISPTNQPMKRKLVRRDSGKTDSPHDKDGNNAISDKRAFATPEPNPATDASPIFQSMKRNLARQDLGKPDSPHNKDGNNDNSDQCTSETPEPYPATDASPENPSMKKMLVRQDLGKTDSPHDKDGNNENNDKSTSETPEPAHVTDASPKNQPMKRKLVRQELGKTGLPHDKDGNSDNSVKITFATPEPIPVTDASPENPAIKRELVRQNFDITDLPHDKDGNNENSDISTSEIPEPAHVTVDASPKNKIQPMKKRLVGQNSGKTGSHPDKDGYNNNGDKNTSTSSEHRADIETKNPEENVKSKDTSENVGSMCSNIPE